MTDIVGLLRDKDDDSTLIHRVYISDTPALIAEGIISGGMIPKIDSMTQALREGVKRHLLSTDVFPTLFLWSFLPMKVWEQCLEADKEVQYGN